MSMITSLVEDKTLNQESNKDNGIDIETVYATPGRKGYENIQKISYRQIKIIGNGTFGQVYQAELNNKIVAIKRVVQEQKYKNRELDIMKKLEHCNIVELIYYFHTYGAFGDLTDKVMLNLILEYVPTTLDKIAHRYAKVNQTMPMIQIRLYLYQLFRSLAYLHSQNICHRDIKPQNILLNPETAVLKLCDFGSAKILEAGHRSVSYMCSRFYRAPELAFGSVCYTTKVDIWSAGCVLGELLLGKLLFPGKTSVDQLVEIIKIMGKPTHEQIHEMNPGYATFKFPEMKPLPWRKVFSQRTPIEVIDLVSHILEYRPSMRITPLQACAHTFFDLLREEDQILPNGKPFPPLFNFTEYELAIEPALNEQLMPKFTQKKQCTNVSEISNNFGNETASVGIVGCSGTASTLTEVKTASCT